MEQKLKHILILITFLVAICIGNSCYATAEPDVSSPSAILIDADSGKVLYEKNSEEKMYPASLTKILTAILTIENCDNLEETVIVNYNAIATIPSGYSIAELQAGEELTVNQLLNVLLVHSANDAANVLAMHVGGTIDSFVSMMNSKALELGCTNSNFTNAYGLQDENHYSTAKDLSIIAQYCMQNNTFRTIVSKKSCTISATNKHDARTYTNTNDMLSTSSKYYYDGVIGIKTGYTKEAKNCLISACNKNNFEVISVVLGAESSQVSENNRYSDTAKMFDFAYSNYSMKTIVNKNDVVTQIKVSNATHDTKELNLLAQSDVNILVSDDTNIEKLTPTIKLTDTLTAPIAQGASLGTATYNIDGIEYTVTLVAEHNVEKSEILLFAFRIILVILILITLFTLLFNKDKRK